MKAQKKPIVIDYLPYKGDIMEVFLWFPDSKNLFIMHFLIEGDKLYVNTLEGTLYEVTTDDVIVRGIDGEYYPCKASIFHKTYDLL